MSAAIHYHDGNVPMKFWPMIVPGVWLGAKIGASMVQIMGYLEFPCANVIDEENLEAEKGDEVKETANCYRIPNLCNTVFWPTVSEKEPESHKYAWNILFLSYLVASIVFVFIMMPLEDIAEFIYLPLLGVAGATIAMSTPVGGAILFVPVLQRNHPNPNPNPNTNPNPNPNTNTNTKPNPSFDIEPINAVAFGVATQMIGMGVFGFSGKLRMGNIQEMKTGKLTLTVTVTVTVTVTLTIISRK